MVDCDGRVGEFCGLLAEVGFNGCVPLEQVCGNDLLRYREALPGFILLGGIEKEIVASGSRGRMERELVPKVSRMMEAGGYFPGFDHSLSTNAGFEELCMCMTRLHELCGSADLGLGEFPRIGPR